MASFFGDIPSAISQVISGPINALQDNLGIILGFLAFALGLSFVLGFLDEALGWSKTSYRSKYTGRSYKL